MEDLIDALAALPPDEGPAALASLVWSSGSIPMSDRAKMLVKSNGEVLGTIGGGCLEAEIVSVGTQVIASGQAQLTDYTMTEKQAGESGLNCGGSVQIYTEQIAGDALEYYRQIAAARLARRPCALVTVLAAQPDLGKMLLFADDRPPLGGGRLLERAIAKQGASVLEQDRGKLVDLTPEKGAESRFGLAAGTRLQAFVEPFLPPPVLYVFGGGHVGGQVARLAKGVGFNVVIVDDRPLFASSQRHPYADQCLVEPMEGVCQRLPIDDQSYIVAATRGHQHDEIVIEQAIDTPARYIGMLGSERKKMILWQRIEARGAQRSQLDRVFAPIGFNIGADTPEEIAVSVTAELIQVRRGPRKVWKTKSAELVV